MHIYYLGGYGSGKTSLPLDEVNYKAMTIDDNTFNVSYRFELIRIVIHLRRFTCMI